MIALRDSLLFICVGNLRFYEKRADATAEHKLSVSEVYGETMEERGRVKVLRRMYGSPSALDRRASSEDAVALQGGKAEFCGK
ncbi:hypothetical protein CVT26_015834 [Gymnopilus dilepis]|uniref:Uncharacterized protein n=1 Tax=Gymnopilus dilepis TaxID=231916 RepID=A0A409X3R6_9AGAR|nr:hypothetical protein CVT26_015834 [Gymnopilus dilepis]